ncbi:AAA family ATPase [Agromyces sp. G08B096]|uniref:AAA family ATPase n=1 Tax=Agromyces sp. G08B096 TaxID=3156399 RepID=A0AAU7W4V4_9MICO
MTGTLVIVTGAPGSGKSTIAARYAERAEHPTVHLVTDHFYRYIRSGWIAPYLPEAQRQNEVVIDAIATAAAAYATGGYDVVIDGIVGPWFLDAFTRTADDRGLDLHYLVLRPDLESTIARALARTEDELRDDSVVRDLYEQFAELGRFAGHVLDTSGLDVDDTVDAVRTLVAGGHLRVAGLG